MGKQFGINTRENIKSFLFQIEIYSFDTQLSTYILFEQYEFSSKFYKLQIKF